jgi:hypothetical protein
MGKASDSRYSTHKVLTVTIERYYHPVCYIVRILMAVRTEIGNTGVILPATSACKPIQGVSELHIGAQRNDLLPWLRSHWIIARSNEGDWNDKALRTWDSLGSNVSPYDLHPGPSHFTDKVPSVHTSYRLAVRPEATVNKPRTSRETTYTPVQT